MPKKPVNKIANQSTMKAAQEQRWRILGSSVQDTFIGKQSHLRRDPLKPRPVRAVFGKVAHVWRVPSEKFPDSTLNRLRAVPAIPKKRKSLAALGLNPPKKK